LLGPLREGDKLRDRFRRETGLERNNTSPEQRLPQLTLPTLSMVIVGELLHHQPQCTSDAPLWCRDWWCSAAQSQRSATVTQPRRRPPVAPLPPGWSCQLRGNNIYKAFVRKVRAFQLLSSLGRP
jgi:hypothetical protein